jgi:hypothetical protein
MDQRRTVIEPFPTETEALIVAVRVDFHRVGRAASRRWAVDIDTAKAVGLVVGGVLFRAPVVMLPEATFLSGHDEAEKNGVCKSLDK